MADFTRAVEPEQAELELRPAVSRQVEQDGAAAARQARAGGPLGTAGVLGLQRSAGNRATTAYLQREADEADAAQHEGAPSSPVHEAVARRGESLDAGTRKVMEPALKTSLSDVKVVHDRASAESVQASAFTVGNTVVMHPDRVPAGSPQAQRTLFHELTHVKQQRQGPVAGTPQAGGIQVSHPSDRFEQEAERTASQVESNLATQRMTAEAGNDEERTRRH